MRKLMVNLGSSTTKVERRRGGVLENDAALQVLRDADRRTEEFILALRGEGHADRAALAASEAAVRELRARAGENDPNAKLIAWTLSQLLLVRFKDSVDPAYGRECIELLQTSEGDWVDQHAWLYEMARAQYEVGRRLEELALVEEAATRYEAAAKLGRRVHGPAGRGGTQLRRAM